MQRADLNVLRVSSRAILPVVTERSVMNRPRDSASACAARRRCRPRRDAGDGRGHGGRDANDGAGRRDRRRRRCAQGRNRPIDGGTRSCGRLLIRRRRGASCSGPGTKHAADGGARDGGRRSIPLRGGGRARRRRRHNGGHRQAHRGDRAAAARHGAALLARAAVRAHQPPPGDAARRRAHRQDHARLAPRAQPVRRRALLPAAICAVGARVSHGAGLCAAERRCRPAQRARRRAGALGLVGLVRR